MSHRGLQGVAAQYQTKRDLTYASLREGILRCDLKPGEEFSVRELAERIGVSPSPVREALSRLQGEGLVQSISSKGFRVTPMSPQLANEIKLVEGALLPLVARHASNRITPEALAELEEMCRMGDYWLQQRARGDSSDPPLMGFHRRLVHVCQMPFLEVVCEMVMDMGDWTNKALVLDRGDLAWERFELAVSGHWEILEALKTGDSTKVERATRVVFSRAMEWFSQYLGMD